MNILTHEIKKILFFPAIIGFVVLAILLNIAVVSTMRNSFANFIAEASHTAGVDLGEEFNERISSLAPSLYKDLLRRQTVNFSDVLYGYTTGYIADAAVERLGLSGLPERLMRWKYERFQYAVDARQAAGDSMTLYFAELSALRHEMLFNYTMGLLLFQGIILAALIMLLSLGYESAAQTEFVVYSTRIGRGIVRYKLAAGVIAGLLIYAGIAAVTLGVLFVLNPMGGVWGSSVSSGFNFVLDGFFTRPFVTWRSFNVAGYLWASLAVSLGIVLCFSLMAYSVGLWVRNSYIGFLLLIAFNGILFLFPYYSNFWMINFGILQSPVWLVLMRYTWFTDGGSNVILPHFETIGVLASLVILMLAGVFSSARFKRRNLL